jgi:murein DD-endopeptidase MepM/ murein hydrolase activator NlpD
MSGLAWKAALATGVCVVLAPLALITVTLVAVSSNADAGTVCTPAVAASGSTSTTSATGSAVAATSINWTAEGSWKTTQVANAAVIVQTGGQLGVPRYGWVIAVATAMQESSLNNLGNLGSRNDHDSLGLFQQRPSQGWGTPAQVMDPVYASTQFYKHLLKINGWQSMALTDAAQKVQRSAYPDAYATWQPDAEHLVKIIAARLNLTQNCAPASAGPWVLPLPAHRYTLTSPFGRRWGSFHYGQDMAAPTGTPIYAASAGVVLEAECTSPFCDRPGEVDSRGAPITPGGGWTVVIDHGGGIATRYHHAVRLNVRAGQHVTAGQLIAWVGSTGHSTGSHLHFEVHRGLPVSNGNAVDPMQFLRSVGLDP